VCGLTDLRRTPGVNRCADLSDSGRVEGCQSVCLCGPTLEIQTTCGHSWSRWLPVSLWSGDKLANGWLLVKSFPTHTGSQSQM